GCRSRWPGRVGSVLHQASTGCGARGRDGSDPPRPHCSPGSEGRVVVELAGRLAVAGYALWLGRRPPQAWADLLGLDLDHSATLAFRGLPAPGPELADDDDPVALGQGVADMGGELPPGGDPVERRVT